MTLENLDLARMVSEDAERGLASSEAASLANSILRNGKNSGWRTDLDAVPSLQEVLVGRWLGNNRWFQIVAQKVPASANKWTSDAGVMTLVPTHWYPLPSLPLRSRD